MQIEHAITAIRHRLVDGQTATHKDATAIVRDTETLAGLAFIAASIVGVLTDAAERKQKIYTDLCSHNVDVCGVTLHLFDDGSGIKTDNANPDTVLDSVSDWLSNFSPESISRADAQTLEEAGVDVPLSRIAFPLSVIIYRCDLQMRRTGMDDRASAVRYIAGFLEKAMPDEPQEYDRVLEELEGGANRVCSGDYTIDIVGNK